MLCRLDSRLVARSPAVVVEVDPFPERARHYVGCVALFDSTQLHADRKHENVRRKAMAALMGGEPEVTVTDLSGKRPVHRGAAERAARIACPVGAD